MLSNYKYCAGYQCCGENYNAHDFDFQQPFFGFLLSLKALCFFQCGSFFRCFSARPCGCACLTNTGFLIISAAALSRFRKWRFFISGFIRALLPFSPLR